MLFNQLEETIAFLKTKTDIKPSIGVVLGSGLGALADDVQSPIVIPYQEIPHFPKSTSTVEGHKGELIFGTLGGKNVMLMAGRFHYYEGYDMKQVTYPIRVMKAMGVETVILSNAAGSMHPDYEVGDIMFLKDHINLFPENPLRGPNDERLGVRFLDMSEPYCLSLLEKASEVAKKQGLDHYVGTYVGLTGPTFETRAEYEYLYRISGDVVGMSTVPEVIVALHGGMKVFAASIVTDVGIRVEMNTITHEEVLEAANAAAPKLSKLVTGLIEAI